MASAQRMAPSWRQHEHHVCFERPRCGRKIPGLPRDQSNAKGSSPIASATILESWQWRLALTITGLEEPDIVVARRVEAKDRFEVLDQDRGKTP
jgi:hypothetical protein